MRAREHEMNYSSKRNTRLKNYITLKDNIGGGLTLPSDLKKVCDTTFNYLGVQQDIVEVIGLYIFDSTDEILKKSIDCKFKINEHYNFNKDLNYFKTDDNE